MLNACVSSQPASQQWELAERPTAQLVKNQQTGYDFLPWLH